MLTKIRTWRPLSFDRYIFSEVFSSFIGSCLFILFILLMFQMLRLAEILIVHDTPPTILGKVVGYMTLSFLPKALPIAFLVSVLTAFGRFSADSELVALKSCGISTLRLSIPLWGFAAGIVLLSVSLHFKWVPWAEVESKKLMNKIGNTRAVTAIKEGTFTSGFFDLLIFADKVDTARNRLLRVFIYDEREASSPLTYIANEAEVIPIKTRSELGSAIMLRLFNGSVHQNRLEDHTYEKTDFKTYQIYLKIDEGEDGLVRKPEMIPEKDLLQIIQNTTVASFEGREMRGEYWKRYATAFSPLIFVLLGIGFGSFRNRTARTGAILTTITVLSIYWSLQLASTSAVQKGTLPPYFAMQIPNLVFLTLGLFGFKRAAW